ncbi:unnamed protein product, partial [Symbiodinium pilosum]
ADHAKETSFAELLQDLRRVMATQSGQGVHQTEEVEGDRNEHDPATPRARNSLASPLGLRQMSPEVEGEDVLEDKENKLNVQNQTSAIASKALTPEAHEVVRKVMKQINFALSFGSRKLYGRPIQDARGFFEALDRHGNGVLDRKDIAQGFKRLDIVLPRTTLEMLVQMVDQDANGLMSVDELLQAMERSEPFTSKASEAGNSAPNSARKRP